MIIKKMLLTKRGICGYCNRDTILRYKVKLRSKQFEMCVLCYEEQIDWAEDHKPNNILIKNA